MTDLTAQTNGSAVNGAALHALNGDASAAVLAGVAPVGAALVPDASVTVEVVPAAAAVTGREIIPVPPANKSATPCDVRVADIRKGQLDCRGEKIDFVFCRRRDYAIYRSGGKIIVQHSDDDAICKTQAAAIAELLPLRSQLQYLVKDMAAPSAYHWQIAEALRLGLDGQKEAAKNTIQNAIDNIIARRVSQGRDIYLMFAGAMVFTIVSLLCAAAVAMPYAWASLQDEITSALREMMMAAGSGAMGAMLSTAMAFRSRTMAIATDVDMKSNAVDSAARIMIGVISAAVIYLVMKSNLLGTFTELKAEKITWQIVLLVGFAAGFMERLVPDLLEKKLTPAAK